MQCNAVIMEMPQAAITHTRKAYVFHFHKYTLSNNQFAWPWPKSTRKLVRRDAASGRMTVRCVTLSCKSEANFNLPCGCNYVWVGRSQDWYLDGRKVYCPECVQRWPACHQQMQKWRAEIASAHHEPLCMGDALRIRSELEA